MYSLDLPSSMLAIRSASSETDVDALASGTASPRDDPSGVASDCCGEVERGLASSDWESVAGNAVGTSSFGGGDDSPKGRSGLSPRSALAGSSVPKSAVVAADGWSDVTSAPSVGAGWWVLDPSGGRWGVGCGSGQERYQ